MNSEMVFPAVALDRDLQGGVREVNPGNEGTILVINDELALSFRETSTIEELNEATLEGASAAPAAVVRRRQVTGVRP
jgi:hypothetical protein